MRLTIILEWFWGALGMLAGGVAMYGGIAYLWSTVNWHQGGGYIVAAIVVGYLICLQIRWPGVHHDLKLWAKIQEEGLDVQIGHPPEDEEDE